MQVWWYLFLCMQVLVLVTNEIACMGVSVCAYKYLSVYVFQCGATHSKLMH